ncbi:MAG: hypothetical protein AAF945_12875 [Actinomycetota bacterium]
MHDRFTIRTRPCITSGPARLAVLIALVGAACGGGEDATPTSDGPTVTSDASGSADEERVTESTEVVEAGATDVESAGTEPATTPTGSVAEAGGESEGDNDALTCLELDVPSPDVAGSVSAPDDEPGVFDPLRSARVVDADHLISDLETTLGSVAPLVLPAGRHDTDALGTPVGLDLPVPWRLMRADPGLLVFASGDETLVQDRPLIRVGRPAAVAPAEIAVDPDAVEPGRQRTVPLPESLLEWFDTVDAIRVESCATTVMSDVDATVFDVIIDPEAGATSFCQPIGECASAFVWHTSGPATPTEVRFNSRYRYRVVEIEQPGVDIIAVAQALPDESAAWFDRATSFLVSWELGEPAELGLPDGAFSSIGDVPPGPLAPLSLPFLRFDLTEPVWAGTLGRTVAFGPIDGPAPWQDGPSIDIFLPSASNDGPISTVDDVVAAFESSDVLADRRPAETLFGLDAVVVTVDGDAESRTLRSTVADPPDPSENDGFGWWFAGPGDVVRIVDIDGVGPLVVSVVGPADAPEGFDDWVRSVLESGEIVPVASG